MKKLWQFVANVVLYGVPALAALRLDHRGVGPVVRLRGGLRHGPRPGGVVHPVVAGPVGVTGGVSV